MLRLKITMKDAAFVTRDCQDQNEADEYLAYIANNHNWGKPERWVTTEEDTSEALESRIIVTQQASEGIEEISYTEYKLASEYIVEQTDISALLAQEVVNKEAEAYLAATDWYVIRMMDIGTPIPDGIQVLRQQARNNIIR